MGGILLILALTGIYVIVYWLIAVDTRKDSVHTGLLAMRRFTEDDLKKREKNTRKGSGRYAPARSKEARVAADAKAASAHAKWSGAKPPPTPRGARRG